MSVSNDEVETIDVISQESIRRLLLIMKMEDRIITQEEIKILKKYDKYSLISTLIFKRKLGIELSKEDNIRLENLAIKAKIITEEEELIDKKIRTRIYKIKLLSKVPYIISLNPSGDSLFNSYKRLKYFQNLI